MAKRRKLKATVKVAAALLVIGILGAGIYAAVNHKPKEAENVQELVDETEHALPIVLDEMIEPEPEADNQQEEQNTEADQEENSSVQNEISDDEIQDTEEYSDADEDEQTADQEYGEQAGTEASAEPEETNGSVILPFVPAD